MFPVLAGLPRVESIQTQQDCAPRCMVYALKRHKLLKQAFGCVLRTCFARRRFVLCNWRIKLRTHVRVLVEKGGEGVLGWKIPIGVDLTFSPEGSYRTFSELG